DGNIAITNNGLIGADLPAGTILFLRANSSGVSNAGTATASGGGVLRIDGGPVANTAAGQVTAPTGSAGQGFHSGVAGGTIATSGTGVVNILGASSLTGLTCATGANVHVPDNNACVLSGTITNNGTVSMDGGGNFTDLRMNGAVSLAGNGSLVLT